MSTSAATTRCEVSTTTDKSGTKRSTLLLEPSTRGVPQPISQEARRSILSALKLTEVQPAGDGDDNKVEDEENFAHEDWASLCRHLPDEMSDIFNVIADQESDELGVLEQLLEFTVNSVRSMVRNIRGKDSGKESAGGTGLES